MASDSALREHIERNIQERSPFNTLELASLNSRVIPENCGRSAMQMVTTDDNGEDKD